jgi:hypothetical protein
MAQMANNVAKTYWRGIKFLDPTSTNGILLAGGTTADPISTGVASKNFIDFRTQSTATSGDSRALYLKHLIAGAGGDGEAGRFYTVVAGVAAGGSSHGVHATGALDATGTSPGQLAGVRATFEVATSTRSLAGTFAALIVESNVGTGVTLPGSNSFIRVVDTGAVHLDNLFDLDASATGIVKGSTATSNNGIKIKWTDGTTKYIMVGV